MEEKRIWGIHTRDENLFFNEKVIAIGWHEMGDLSKIKSDREVFRQKMFECYPKASKQSIATQNGQVFRFKNEIQIGDYVVFPSKSDRMINIGVIEGEYFYSPEALESVHKYVNQRKVKWLKHLPRTLFSQGALYEIGSAMSLFSIRNYAEEFLAALDKDFKKNVEQTITEDESVAATAEDIIDNTRDYVLKELKRQLKGYDLEDFVANLLEAMGYHTTVSKHGGDRGIDIIAYKDELPPRIVVQVKSCDGDITETTIHSLRGAMAEGDYGLFVSLSDYAKNAKKFLNEHPIIRGINGTEFVDLVLEYYDHLDKKYRDIIPLKKVYIPVPKTEDEKE